MDVELLSRFALYVAHVVAWVNVGVAGALSLGLAMMVVSVVLDALKDRRGHHHRFASR